jgi:4-hydroxybenzoate polyprenyltransferase
MDTKMYLFKSTWITMITALSTVGAFIGSYFMNLTADNTEQYLAVIAVVLLDGFFGLCAGIKREGFKTYKAVKVLKTIFAWVLILTVILSVELGFTGTGWLSETILIPFIIFQIISSLKNASMAGFIQNDLLNEILDRIDKHKGNRK